MIVRMGTGRLAWMVWAAVALVAAGCAPGGGGGGEGGAGGAMIDGGAGAGGEGGMPGAGGVGGGGGEGGLPGAGGEGGLPGAGGEGGMPGAGGEGGMPGAGGEGGGGPIDPTAGSGTCSGTTFAPDDGVAFLEDYGTYVQALDPNDPATALIVEIHDDRGEPVTVGGHDLAGNTLRDCRVCVLACTVVNNRCSSIYFADEGVVNITARGSDVNEPLAFDLHRVRFKQVTIDQQAGQANLVPNGDSWCGDGYQFESPLRARPAEVGDTVRDFSLQNCATEAFDSIHDIAADVRALWMIATAGWCPACREYLPQALAAGNDVPEAMLKTIVILGENAQYGQPTLAYCRQYASTYGEDGSRFYIDHNGEGSFATTFSYMWPYVGDQGEFGLPWNAVMAGGSFRYEYADGFEGARGGAGDAINRLLR